MCCQLCSVFLLRELCCTCDCNRVMEPFEYHFLFRGFSFKGYGRKRCEDFELIERMLMWRGQGEVVQGGDTGV